MVVCIKNKGVPGKLFKNYKTIRMDEKDSFKPFGYSTRNNSNTRHNSLLEAIKVLSYSTVVHKLSALRTFHKDSDEDVNKKLYNKFNEDIKKLKEWREQNPNLYKHKNQNNILENIEMMNTKMNTKNENLISKNNAMMNSIMNTKNENLILKNNAMMNTKNGNFISKNITMNITMNNTKNKKNVI